MAIYAARPLPPPRVRANPAPKVVSTRVGVAGLSAYQIALRNGFSGTEEEWIDSLQGEDGAAGIPDIIDGGNF